MIDFMSRSPLTVVKHNVSRFEKIYHFDALVILFYLYDFYNNDNLIFQEKGVIKGTMELMDPRVL